MKREVSSSHLLEQLRLAKQQRFARSSEAHDGFLLFNTHTHRHIR